MTRDLEYQIAGSAAVAVRGHLKRPDEEDLVGGLDEEASVFMCRYADLVTATGASAFSKFDKVIDGTRVYNVASVATIYQGKTPAFVRAEVVG